MPSARRHRIPGAAALAMSIVLGCAACTDDTGFSQTRFGDATVIIARPSSRIVTERPRGVGADRRSVLCTEPSPDVAIALARSGNVSGGASVPSGPSANLGGGFSAAETATKMDGRTAAVVALRDGLYFACQGYVNGVLGLNSYALILSQYGRLLGELVGAEAAGTTPRPASGPPGTAAPRPGEALAAAMFVACIAEFDPSGDHVLDGAGHIVGNALLQANCPGFMNRLARPD